MAMLEEWRWRAARSRAPARPSALGRSSTAPRSIRSFRYPSARHIDDSRHARCRLRRRLILPLAPRRPHGLRRYSR